MSKDQPETATLSESAEDSKQKTAGGNYPWSTESDLETETNKEMDPAINPAITTTISEIISKIERGPIFLENEVAHPYFKPTLRFMYVKRPNQVLAEAKVIIPFHLLDELSEKVVADLKSKVHEFETPVTIVCESTDKAGVVNGSHSGYVKQYRLRDIEPNSGSISATLEGTIIWNK